MTMKMEGWKCSILNPLVDLWSATWIQKYFKWWEVTRNGKCLLIITWNNLDEDLSFHATWERMILVHINISNEFLKELLEIWTEVHFIQSNGLEENYIKNQLIWYNSCIRVENKPIYYKNWATNGIIKIKDLLDNENDILDFEKFQKKV